MAGIMFFWWLHKDKKLNKRIIRTLVDTIEDPFVTFKFRKLIKKAKQARE